LFETPLPDDFKQALKLLRVKNKSHLFANASFHSTPMNIKSANPLKWHLRGSPSGLPYLQKPELKNPKLRRKCFGERARPGCSLTRLAANTKSVERAD